MWTIFLRIPDDPDYVLNIPDLWTTQRIRFIIKLNHTFYRRNITYRFCGIFYRWSILNPRIPWNLRLRPPQKKFNRTFIMFHSNENTMEMRKSSLTRVNERERFESMWRMMMMLVGLAVCTAHFTMTAPCLEKKWFDLIRFVWMCAHESEHISQSQKLNNEYM